MPLKQYCVASNAYPLEYCSNGITITVWFILGYDKKGDKILLSGEFQ